MRKTMWGAAAALALVSTPAAAGTPVSTQPLAAGEVLLEVNALGVTLTPADEATVRVQLSSTGATEAEARREHAALVRRLTQVARSAGAAAADIDVGPVTVEDLFDFDSLSIEVPDIPSGSGDDSMQLQDDAPPPPIVRVPVPVPPGQIESEAAERKVARATMVVRLRDPSRAAALFEALGSVQGASALTPPEYRLTDDRAARRAARADAIASARADAEAYASALGMRVVRIVRVSERLGIDLLGLGVSEWPQLQEIGMRFMIRDAEVQTFVAVGVDFALAPQ